MKRSKTGNQKSKLASYFFAGFLTAITNYFGIMRIAYFSCQQVIESEQEREFCSLYGGLGKVQYPI